MPDLYLPDAHISFLPLSIRRQVYCPFSTSLTRISPFYRCLSGFRCIAHSLPLRHASLFSAAICLATGVLPVLYLSDAHLPFPPLATGALPALYLSDAHLPFPSLFLATGALPALYLYGAHPPFSPLAVPLQVHCPFSTSDMHLPFPATGACPFSMILTHISPYHRYLSGYRCVARSLSPTRISPFHRYLSGFRCVLAVYYLSDEHLPFPPLAIQQQVCCPLSTSPTRISPFHRHLSCYRCAARSLPL